MADRCRAIPIGTYRDQTLAAVEYLHPSACPLAALPEGARRG